MHKNRPKHLDLRHIKLPITGMVSILHRLSGLGLFLALPFLLLALGKSIESESAYMRLLSGYNSFLIKVLFLLCLWGLLHHLFSGLRILALDSHLGTALPAARKTAWLAIGGGIGLVLLIGAQWW